MMKFKGKTIQCGYHGIKLLKEVKVGTKTVCSSTINDSQYFPQAPAPTIFTQPTGTQFEVLLHSTVSVNYTPTDIMDSTSSNSWSTWSFQPYSNDSTGHWYSLTCSSPVAKFRMNTAGIFDRLIVTKSRNGTPLHNTSFYRCFIGLRNLKSAEFTTNMGPILNFHDIFARNASVEYVKFYPMHFGASKNFHGLFHECYSLKYVTYLDTSMWGTNSGFDRTYMFTSCNNLIRPSSDEQSFLIAAWGGKFKFSFTDRFMGVKDMMLNVTKTHNMTHATFADILFYDENGVLLRGGNFFSTNQAAIPHHGSSHILDNNIATYWQSAVNIPTWIMFTYTLSNMKLSQVRIRAKPLNEWNHPLGWSFSMDPVGGNPDGIISSFSKTQYFDSSIEWAAREERSFLIDPA